MLMQHQFWIDIWQLKSLQVEHGPSLCSLINLLIHPSSKEALQHSFHYSFVLQLTTGNRNCVISLPFNIQTLNYQFIHSRFAALACITFYFWLAFLALNSVYCFGFLAHEGPCKVNKITGHPVQNPVISTPLTTSADFHGVRSIVSTPKPSSAPFIYDSLW